MRRYDKEWDDIPSVTQVTGMIMSPGLVNWFKNTSPEDIRNASQKSLNIGKTVHKVIEEVEKGKPIELVTEYPEEVQNAVKGYFQWRKDKKIKDVQSEIKLRCDAFKGTFDRVCEANKKLILLDWKTSKAIYPESLLQAMAYWHLYLVNFKKKIEEVWIIRLGKETAEFEPYMIPKIEMPFIKSEFFNLLSVFNWFRKKDKENLLKRKEKENGNN